MKKLTRNDIAKIAKVSPSTVSRALSGSPFISESTTEKIRRITEKLGYSPNLTAKRLASKRSWQIGFAIEFRGQRICKGPIQMGYYSGILDGVLSFAYQAGYTISVRLYEEDNEDSALRFTKLYDTREIDGLIFAGLRCDSKMIRILKRKKIPFVLIGVKKTGVSSVNVDFLDPYREAMKILSERGVERIFFVRGDPVFGYASPQEEALNEAAMELGIKIVQKFDGDYSMRCGYLLSPKIVDKAKKGDCVIFANDRMATGFYRFCYEKGIKIPTDIRVIGSDKDPISTALFPSLSTVIQPRLKMGQEAFRLIRLRIEKGKNINTCIEQKFFLGDSI